MKPAGQTSSDEAVLAGLSHLGAVLPRSWRACLGGLTGAPGAPSLRPARRTGYSHISLRAWRSLLTLRSRGAW